MIVSVGSVTALFLWSIFKVLRTPPVDPDSLHGFEFETPDEKTGEDPEELD